jgi:hypothetical protein
MKHHERRKLIQLLFDSFKEIGLKEGLIWEDLTPRSQNNAFNLQYIPPDSIEWGKKQPIPRK